MRIGKDLIISSFDLDECANEMEFDLSIVSVFNEQADVAIDTISKFISKFGELAVGVSVKGNYSAMDGLVSYTVNVFPEPVSGKCFIEPSFDFDGAPAPNSFERRFMILQSAFDLLNAVKKRVRWHKEKCSNSQVLSTIQTIKMEDFIEEETEL